MKISAVICTYNGALHLDKTIFSLLNQSLNKKDYEIIVIDNNSIDKTKKICAAYKEIKYFCESKQGLSYARNRGLKESTGKYIAFIDDDAIADKKWLENILNAFQRNKELGCVCGKVEPVWESKRPSWLSNQLLPILSIVNWSKKPIFLDKNQWFVGTNMAFSKEILITVKGFDTSLGRKVSNLLSGEETYLKNKLEAHNYSSYYNPKIIVKHYISSSRLQKKWFMRRYWWQGISNAIIEKKSHNYNFFKKIKLSLCMSFPLLYNPFLWFGNFEKKCSNFGRLGFSYGMLIK